MMPSQVHRASSLGLARLAGQGLVLGARGMGQVIVHVGKLSQVKGAVLDHALRLLKALPGLLCLEVERPPGPGCIGQLLVQLA